MIKKWFQRLLNNGIYPDTKETLIKNIRVLNTISLLVMLTEISVIPLAIIFYEYTWPILIVCLVMIILITITFFLVKRKKYCMGAVLGALAAVNNIFWFTFLLGTGIYAHFLMPAIMIGAFYYFSYEHRKAMFLVIAVSLAAFFFLEFWFLNHLPIITLPEEALGIIKIFVGMMFSIITFGFMYYGYRIYREAETSLNQSRQKLLERNNILETEIEMARRIQMQIIPNTSPDPRIAFYYQPMDKVGGDFFDFFQFPDPGITGIFLSDVSGHGVPAAFITSMIKSTLLECAAKTIDPGEVLKHLNDSLFSQTGGNFVTAFYGIFRWDTRELTFANAGHNLPYLLRNGKVTFLASKMTSPPLFVLENSELDTLGKAFSSETCVLPEQSRILFYTDGLTEAIRETPLEEQEINPADFEAGGLIQSMCVLENRTCAGFVDGLFSSLKEYRGSDRFEDDVCIISMDVNDREN